MIPNETEEHCFFGLIFWMYATQILRQPTLFVLEELAGQLLRQSRPRRSPWFPKLQPVSNEKRDDAFVTLAPVRH